MLNDLDRDLVWRIGYIGRRWEVLGPEAVAGPAVRTPGVARQAEGADDARPRHAAPEPLMAQGNSTLSRSPQ